MFITSPVCREEVAFALLFPRAAAQIVGRLFLLYQLPWDILS